MCNACGFYCCAYDGFSKCGCDHCPNPACWDEEDYDEEFGGDDDDAHDDNVQAGYPVSRTNPFGEKD